MSKRFIAFLIGCFVLAAVAFFYTLYQGSILSPLKPLAQPGTPGAASEAPPPVPGVSLTVYASKQGNTLVVQWHDLPDGTVVLDIFRRPVTNTSTLDWKLWKQITLSPGELSSGMAQFDIGSALFNNYSFSVEAVSNTSTGIIWSSSPSQPTISTSTPPAPPGENDNGPVNNPPPPSSPAPTSSAPVTPSSTSSSTANNNSNQTSSSSSSAPSTPPGTPYYSPQVQISGYGQAPSGNFWVQHIDQKIQIGWQDLPPQTTGAAVLRAASDTGPWSTVLAQQDPVIEGPYSIQLVDDTVGQPYYYEMDIFSGSTTIGTYGPAYLPAVGQ